MKELALSLSNGIKGVFREKIDFAITLLLVIFVFTVYAYVKILNRIDYRYHCQKRTTEMVFNVEVGSRGILKGTLTKEQIGKKEQYEQELSDYRHHKKQLWDFAK